MATKAQVEKALKLIEQQREAAAAAAAAEQQAQNDLHTKLGEVLVAAAQKPRTKWAEYRDKPLTELLAELGLIDAEQAADKADSDAAAEDESAADSADSGGDSGSESGDSNDDETTVSLAGREPIQDGRSPDWQ
ncbi:hypothetical protein [Corynebacterium riegelii]|uniref:hypothetical protein n=1 Tax=Corynebacterium riegelii TaxID=156976 RepID=UPI000C7729E8|nr:hypothetical protein [Corynebacterium riegelii]PLA11761.1 hypothetical protein CYJ48_08950 [Corynebacterium riegelii]